MNKWIYGAVLPDLFMILLISIPQPPFSSWEEGPNSLKTLLMLLGIGFPKETWVMPQQDLEFTRINKQF